MAARDQAWASGRVLSAAQRERKRVIDRERSSHRRRQTTARINGLEAKLKALEEAGKTEKGPSNDTRTDAECTPVSTLDEYFWQSFGSIQPNGNSSPSERDQSSECQSIFNETLMLGCSMSRYDICTDAQRNEDALIRGIVYGWDKVSGQNDFFCPLWTIIRFLDARFFRLSSTITRFCTLTMIHSMLLCLVNANELSSLPYWYRPRPTQKSIPHPLAIDVLPWPGLRERAILDPTLTLSSRFWSDVIYCFRFCWPHEDVDAVKVNPQSKLYGFTGKFQNSVRDINKWHMDQTFFETFPETYDDIVPAPLLERSLIGGTLWPDVDFSALPCLPLPASDEEVSLESLRERATLAAVSPVRNLEGFSAG